MTLSITKVIDEISKEPCSKHEIVIAEGGSGVLVVQCIHCKQKWTGRELGDGGTEVLKVADSYTLQKTPEITKKTAEKTVVKSESREGIINPALENLKGR